MTEPMTPLAPLITIANREPECDGSGRSFCPGCFSCASPLDIENELRAQRAALYSERQQRQALEEKLAKVQRLIYFALNGWGAWAKRDMEHNEISRIRIELAKLDTDAALQAARRDQEPG